MKKNKLLLTVALLALLLSLAALSLHAIQQSKFWHSLSTWFAKPVEVKIDLPGKFKGKWDSQFAWNAVEAELARDSWYKTFENCDQACRKSEVDHSYLIEFELPNSGQERHILLASSKFVGKNCHACPVFISLFEFEKIAEQWQITKQYLNFTPWGSYGRVDAEQISLEGLDKQGYLLTMLNQDSEQGYAESDWALFYINTQGVTRVLSLSDYHADNSGAVSDNKERSVAWQGSHQFDYQNGVELPDVVYLRVGVVQAKTLKEQRRYRYDGQTYQLLQEAATDAPVTSELRAKPAEPDLTQPVAE